MTVLDDVVRPSAQRTSEPAWQPSPAGRPSADATPVRPPRRSRVVIATLAVLGALWMGFTAPAVSPVSGPPPAGQPVAPVAVVRDVAPPTVDQPFVLGDGRPGRGRR